MRPKTKAEQELARAIGARVREARLIAKMAQVELGKRLELTQPSSMTYRFEAGTRGIPILLLTRIAHILNVSLDYLMTGKLSRWGKPGERLGRHQ